MWREQSKKNAEDKVGKEKLILGTHTSEGEQNYLMIAEAHVPLSDVETDNTGYDEERGEVGGFGAGVGKVQVLCPLPSPPCCIPFSTFLALLTHRCMHAQRQA